MGSVQLLLNWKAGLFRLWLIASVCWIAYASWSTYESVVIPREAATARYDDCVAAEKDKPNGSSWNCVDGVLEPGAAEPSEALSYLRHAGFIFGPPALALGLWYATLWVSAGFRQTPINSSKTLD
jgi:hypothetical protein